MMEASEQWLTGYGQIRYSPARRDDCRKRNNPWWVVVDVDTGIADYYRAWVEWSVLNPPWATAGIRLQPPMWGAHITILDGRREVAADRMTHWGRLHDTTVTFQYSPWVEQHWKFWSVPVRCPVFDAIREELGLFDPKPYHITVGRMP